MNESRHFTSRIAVVLAVAALVGTSAFAESRPPRTTDTRGKARETVQRNRPMSPAPVRAGAVDAERQRPAIADRSDRLKGGDVNRRQTTSREQERSYDRSRPRDERGNGNQGAQSYNGSRNGNGDRGDDGNRGGQGYRGNNGNRGSQGYRGDDGDRGGGKNHSSYGGNHAKRMPYYAHGRVSQVHPYGNGYRVWVHGAPYPFFVPAAYYHQGHFGIGMTIRVGGYYNPRGYYDYYGDYASNAIAGEQLRGVVESIDHYRGVFVINLAGRDGYVTVRIPDRPERIWEGAYVVVYGDWSRGGLFIARDVDVIDDDYRW